jgi:hypothetical protein
LLLQNFGLFWTEYDKEHKKYPKCRKKSRNKLSTGNETPTEQVDDWKHHPQIKKIIRRAQMEK